MQNIVLGNAARVAIVSLLVCAGISSALSVTSTEGKAKMQSEAPEITYKNPVWAQYMADPAASKFRGEYYAYGTTTTPLDRQFSVLHSKDLVNWRSLGGALTPLKDPAKTDYWAPEVTERDGTYYMYYSAGGPAGEHHQLRVATAKDPAGPFVDTGKVLMPEEPFSIDAHPFRDPKTGKWYLFFAKDFFDGRVGTGVAAVELGDDMTSVVGPVKTIVRASADWQIFERNRTWYGKTWDAWHTVEGPFMVFCDGKYYCLYSGGRWDSENYGLGYAVADEVLGTYRDTEDSHGPSVLQGTSTLLGPGHNSVVLGPDDKTLFVVYHAWDPGHTARRMCLDPLVWVDGKPKCDGPSSDTKTVKLELAATAAK